MRGKEVCKEVKDSKSVIKFMQMFGLNETIINYGKHSFYCHVWWKDGYVLRRVLELRSKEEVEVEKGMEDTN